MKKTPREAAERVLIDYREMCREELPNVTCVPENSICYEVILAVAYLAEHPADEGEPVTPQWLESVGFHRDGTMSDDPFAHPDSSLRLSPHCKDDSCWVVFVEVYELGNVRTRRDVRRLMVALGIPQVKP